MKLWKSFAGIYNFASLTLLKCPIPGSLLHQRAYLACLIFQASGKKYFSFFNFNFPCGQNSSKHRSIISPRSFRQLFFVNNNSSTTALAISTPSNSGAAVGRGSSSQHNLIIWPQNQKNVNRYLTSN